MAQRLVKMQIPVSLATITGVLMIIEYFFNVPKSVTDTKDVLNAFISIISAAALILGTIVLTIYHARKLSVRKQEWYYSIVYLVGFAVTAVLGIVSVRNDVFLWIYNNMTSPIGAALYSLTAFYITSAAYRVFRARNWNAAVLLVSAFVVLMMLIPIGAVILPPVVPLGEWLRSYPSAAGFRGMILGTSLGIVGLGVRVFAGRQREHFGVRGEGA